MMKTCSKCKIEKEFSEFGKDRNTKDGLYPSCKLCKKAYRDKQEVKEKRSLKQKEYHSIPEVKEKRSLQAKEYNSRPEIKEKSFFYKREYLSKPENKKRKSIYDMNRRSEPGMKEKINSRHNKRIKTDQQFKIRCYLRSRLKNIIKNNTKSGSAVSDLGCSIKFLKEYLESKFQTGMSWDNWSVNGWHIDHIIPLSSFDLTNREELLKAVHYTNLQPLWAKDNLSKGDKIL